MSSARELTGLERELILLWRRATPETRRFALDAIREAKARGLPLGAVLAEKNGPKIRRSARTGKSAAPRRTRARAS